MQTFQDLPHYLPPLDPLLAANDELCQWLLPRNSRTKSVYGGLYPSSGYVGRSEGTPDSIIMRASSWGHQANSWYLRLPPGTLVIDPDDKRAGQLVEQLIAAGQLPETRRKVQSPRGMHRWYRFNFEQNKRLLKGLDIIPSNIGQRSNNRKTNGVIAPDGIDRRCLPGFNEEPALLTEPQLVNLIEEWQKLTGQIPATRREQEWVGEGRSVEWQDRSGPYADRPPSSDQPLKIVCHGLHGLFCAGGRNNVGLETLTTWGFRAWHREGRIYTLQDGTEHEIGVVKDLEWFIDQGVNLMRKHVCPEHWDYDGEVYLEPDGSAGPELVRIAEAAREFVIEHASRDGRLASQTRKSEKAAQLRRAECLARQARLYELRSSGHCRKSTAQLEGCSEATVSALAAQRGPRALRIFEEVRQRVGEHLPAPRPQWGCRPC